MKIFQLLTENQALEITHKINESKFVEGISSARGLAKNVKNNYELDISDEVAKSITNNLYNILINCQWLRNHYLPRIFSLPIINKYKIGSTYGRHIDSSYLKHGMQFIRGDLSYTLMLSRSNDYVGGDLIIENNSVKTKVKLEIGQIIVYPSMLWHQVEPIVGGERIACIGWIESAIKNEEARELLSLWEDFALNHEKLDLSEDDLLMMSHFKNKLQSMLSKT